MRSTCSGVRTSIGAQGTSSRGRGASEGPLERWERPRSRRRDGAGASLMAQRPGTMGGSATHATPAPVLNPEEHTSEHQSPCNLVCRLLLEKQKLQEKKKIDVDVVPGQVYLYHNLDALHNSHSLAVRYP